MKDRTCVFPIFDHVTSTKLLRLNFRHGTGFIFVKPRFKLHLILSQSFFLIKIGSKNAHLFYHIFKIYIYFRVKLSEICL